MLASSLRAGIAGIGWYIHKELTEHVDAIELVQVDESEHVRIHTPGGGRAAP